MMNAKTVLMGLGIGIGIGAAGIVMNVNEVDACGLGDVDFKVTTQLNFRTQPNTQTGVVITKLPKGAVVRPIEKKGGWVKFEYKGRMGWSSLSYLQMIDKCTIPSNPEFYDVKEIKGGKPLKTTVNLNFRSEPNGQKLGVFAKGKNLIAYKETANWYYVEDGHTDGWVSKKYVVQNDEAISNAQKDDITHFIGSVNSPTGYLNFRADRTTSSRILTKLKNGDKLDIKYQAGGWLRVNYTDASGKVYMGYVAAQYVR